MSRIRQDKKRAENRRSIKLKEEVIEDLRLHLNFLNVAHKGMSMNLLTYRKPTHIYRADACPFGLGGFSAEGRAWRWYIPFHLQFRATINMLEHLASIIGPWIDLLEEKLPKLSCILAMTDSTTTAGWLRKSNFQESPNESKEMTKAKLDISRGHATRLLNNQCMDYSQWFPGEKNDIADSLSRDKHLSNSQLNSLFSSKIPSQMPNHFKISPIPQEIELFLLSLLQSLPEQTQQQEKHNPSKVSLGQDGQSSSDHSKSTMTFSCPNSPIEKKNHHISICRSSSTKTVFQTRCPSLGISDSQNRRGQRISDLQRLRPQRPKA